MIKTLLNNSRGITLVELLATLAIVGIIGTLAYNVLFQGYSNYERIQAETKLRDEADLIMASFVREMFVLKEEEIELTANCLNGTAGSCLKVNKVNPNESFFLGFQQDSPSSDIAIVRNKPVRFYNDDVYIVPNNPSNGTIFNSIQTDNGIEFTIRFTLSTDYRDENRQMEFTNVINVIKEDEEGAESESN